MLAILRLRLKYHPLTLIFRGKLCVLGLQEPHVSRVGWNLPPFRRFHDHPPFHHITASKVFPTITSLIYQVILCLAALDQSVVQRRTDTTPKYHFRCQTDRETCQPFPIELQLFCCARYQDFIFCASTQRAHFEFQLLSHCYNISSADSAQKMSVKQQICNSLNPSYNYEGQAGQDQTIHHRLHCDFVDS